MRTAHRPLPRLNQRPHSPSARPRADYRPDKHDGNQPQAIVELPLRRVERGKKKQALLPAGEKTPIVLHLLMV